jgi:hypothetical protein
VSKFIDTPNTIPTPLEFIPIDASGEQSLSREAAEPILIHTVHDGDSIPSRFLVDDEGHPLVDRELFSRSFTRMRDWGANKVARALASALGLDGYASCRVARVLLDFNRFPGTTSRSAEGPLDYFAINEPFGSVLRHAQKMDVLKIYDRMSDEIEKLISGSLISIGIHTYDVHNASATKRPDVSIVSTPQSYFRHSRLPDGVFDPLYPDLLAESTCSRALRDRISLNLERSGFRVSHNQPYPLPEGSVEVRAQVWRFFRYLKERFEEAHPETRDDPGFQLVWPMLLNTNVRSQQSDALSGYLHRYRRPAPEQERTFQQGRDAYARLHRFVEESDVVPSYRRSAKRPSALAIEVRKDLLVTFDPETGFPLPRTAEQDERAQEIAEVIASAVRIYLETDRPIAQDHQRL